MSLSSDRITAIHRAWNEVYALFKRLRCAAGWHRWMWDTSEAGRVCTAWGGWAEECRWCHTHRSWSNRF